MYTSEKILNILQSDKQVLKNLHLARIGLFGSAARGTQSENSDLDFLIEFEEGFKNFGEKFDLVTKESLTPFIYNSVLKDIKYVQIVD